MGQEKSMRGGGEDLILRPHPAPLPSLEIREYAHMPIPKLYAAVSVAEQVINPFSVSHLTYVGKLEN